MTQPTLTNVETIVAVWNTVKQYMITDEIDLAANDMIEMLVESGYDHDELTAAFIDDSAFNLTYSNFQSPEEDEYDEDDPYYYRDDMDDEEDY